MIGGVENFFLGDGDTVTLRNRELRSRAAGLSCPTEALAVHVGAAHELVVPDRLPANFTREDVGHWAIHGGHESCAVWSLAANSRVILAGAVR